LAFGGQALIEGVMMRSRTNMVMCVRKPNKDIVAQVEKLNPLADKYKLLGKYKIFGVPFIRGIIGLFESLYLGIKGLIFSANISLEDLDKDENRNTTTNEPFKLGYGALAVVVLATIGMLAFFFIVPYVLAGLLGLKGWIFNLTEALIRLGMFVAYLSAIASWGEFRRVLQYHGAEHKAINAHEAGVPMDVEHVRQHSRLHPRCGTSFLFIILIVSIILFSIMPDLGFWINLSYRILLIPVIAGLSYELLRLSGKYRNSKVVKVLVSPGLAFQLLTTKEPTDDMLEVSIKAVQEVIKLANI
jgi:uncharacterized protein YqhQ